MKYTRPHGAMILARYSTDNQNPDTIEVQVDRCTQYCHEHNLPILGIYSDYAVSGMKDTRPQERRMMEDLRNHLADTVVIYDQSRMFRDMLYWFQFRNELAEMGVEIRSATQPNLGGDLQDPSIFLSEAVTAAFNQMHVLVTRQKTIEKLNYMARHAIHTGGKPALGYQVVSDEDGKKRLAIEESEAAIVRRIFQEYDSGMSYHEIIDGLNRDGLRTKRGSPFGSNSLHDLLQNERYTGTLIYNSHAKHGSPHSDPRKDVIRIPDALPAIIDRGQFSRVQLRMAENKRAQAGRIPSTRSYPLKGKVFCGDCGCAMCVRRANHDYNYYACSDSRRTHICKNPAIRIDQLEQTVASYVRSILGDDDLRDTAILTIRQEAARIASSGMDRLDKLNDDLFRTKTQTARLVDAIANGSFSDAIRDKLQQLEAHEKEVRLQIDALDHAIQTAALPMSAIEDIFLHIQSALPDDIESILSVVTRVEVSSTSIRIYTLYDPTDPTNRTRTKDLSATATEFITIPGDPGGSPTIVITSAGFILTLSR